MNNTRQKGDIQALITPYNPPRMFKPVKRTKGMIDLTSTYLEDYAAFRKLSDDKARAEQHAQDVLDSQIEQPAPPIPHYEHIKLTPKQAFLLFRNITNPLRFRP